MYSTPPLSNSRFQIVLPELQTIELYDGTRVNIIEKPTAGLVTIKVIFHTGDVNGTVPGAIAFMAELLTRRTKCKDTVQWNTYIEQRGCTIAATTSHSNVVFTGTGLAEHFSFLVDALGECLGQPGLIEIELERLKLQWITEAQINHSDPEWLAGRAMHIACYGNHRYGTPVRGNVESMEEHTIQGQWEAYRTMVSAQRDIVVTGPLSSDDVAATVRNLLHDFPTPRPSGLPDDVREVPHTAVVAGIPDALQTVYSIAMPAVGYHHPDYARLLLVTTVLGGYSLARLFMELRERKAYTYGAYSELIVRRFSALTIITTAVGSEYSADALDSIANIVHELAAAPIPAEELHNAKQFLVGEFLRRTETAGQLADLIQTGVIHELPWSFFADSLQHLQNATPEDLLSVQHTYLTPDQWSIGVSGNPSQLMDAVSQHSGGVSLWVPDVSDTEE